MTRNPESLAHQEWLGYVQPTGLVVSIPALMAAQAHIDRNIAPVHQRFLACLPRNKDDEPIPELRDFAQFTRSVLAWREGDLVPVRPGDPQYAAIEVTLPEYHETLRPTHVIREFTPKDPANPWMILIRVLPVGTELDKISAIDDRHWQATPQAKFERLLRETQVPIGLLVSDSQIRLVYAPRGETSGFATFNVAEMVQVAGRPIFAALHMLLGEERLFSLAEKQRLPAILADSRKYQNVVSTKLAEQVLSALFELVRGFQAADDQAKSELLQDVLAADPNHVYHGLLTVLMRLVFILYAEDRGLLSSDPVYVNYYAVTGLFDRLRADAGRFPDTMDLRYGAWAQLLTLFRLIYEGGSHGGLQIPARHGYLFDPDRYNFLEGRPWQTRRRDADGEIQIPRVSDGVIFRVLNNLLILDGERLSYRTLDVEQIGSVYEAIMGFNLEVARGPSIAIKPKKAHGAPASINLDDLLAAKPTDRPRWLKDQTDQALTGQALDALKKAATIEDLLSALEKRIAREVTPNVASKGAMVLQPSDERRRSGSHYTPRSLTEPIVRTTLKPILDRLGDQVSPDQILDLKVCDPAMGSGAFLVEACRQLAGSLVKSWHVHDCAPSIPPDEDEVLHARRVVAQRCVYGVDKNHMAVDLTKLSLWLATLAKDHPFTFLDHALRCGDSLVGLSTAQIVGFHWNPEAQRDFVRNVIGKRIERATESRREIREAPDNTPESLLSQKLALADESLNPLRFYGEVVIAAFFAGENDKKRKEKLEGLAESLATYLANPLRMSLREPLDAARRELTSGDKPIAPFHWEIEFPEVFGRENPGFDAFVGNPPFLGGRRIREALGGAYFDWLSGRFDQASGNADLVSFFFRRAFDLLRQNGAFGLIATNTIGQGDTRSSGLRWICNHGGTIFEATRRKKWPGLAAVIISVVHVSKGSISGPLLLDGRAVSVITAYLFHAGGHDDPMRLRANEAKSFQGSIVLGMGFTFDDTDTNGVANPISQMRNLIQNDPRNAERICPYIGGEEVNNSPTHAYHRFVINFGDLTEEKAREWPDLMTIVEQKVKPERTRRKPNGAFALRAPLPQRWWIYADKRPGLYEAIRGLKRIVVCPQTSNVQGFAFVSPDQVFAHTLVVFPLTSWSSVCTLQSRIHQIWAAFLGPTMKDDLRYTPSDCFETFPFPEGFETHPALEIAGQDYYDFRAALMVKNNEGLTKTYNRFHDPYESSPEIKRLRELHDAMDRAVLDAYGWTDLKPTCDFLLDYEDEEDEDEGETAPTGRTRKKPWRFRWPDEFRDEVLARLLELNRRRAEQERLSGAAAEAGQGNATKKSTARRKAAKNSPAPPKLFET